MFERLQDIFKSAETRRQERTTAYIDGEMSPAQRAAFEADMARDPALKADVSALMRLRGAVRRVPRHPVPRNFILDPAQYRAPAATRSQRAYPPLRIATALAGIAFVFLFTLTLLQDNSLSSSATLSEPQAVAATRVVADNQALFVEEAVEAADVQEEIAPQVAEAEVAAAPPGDDADAADESQSARAMAEESAIAAGAAAMESAEESVADTVMVDESADMLAAEPVSTAAESPSTTVSTPAPTPTATSVATDTPQAVAKAVVPTETPTPPAGAQADLATESDQSDSTTSTPLFVAGVVFLMLLGITILVSRRR